jgi:hypothetical protein
MDYSQYIRLKQEAANMYLARNKPVDSSFLTMQKQQKASYSGASRFNTAAYFKGNPTLNPILYDISSCPIDHAFTEGYTNSLKLCQQESMASEKAGAILCGGPDYSTAPSGIFLLNEATCSTIRSSYNNNSLKPSIFEPQIENIIYDFPRNLASMYFDGSSFAQASIDNVYTGNSDFTIEFFVRPSAVNQAYPIQTLFFIGAAATTNLSDTYKFTGSLIADPGTGSKSYKLSVQISTVGTIVVGELYQEKWHHVAVMRFGNIMYFYINGQRVNYIVIPQNIPASGTPGTTNYLSGSESAITIGGKYDGFIRTGQTFALTNAFIGHMTNFRWTKGMAMYTEPIGVPPVTTLVNKFKTPVIPLFIYSRSDAFTHLYRYVSVGLLAESTGTLLANTRSPSATVSITDGNTVNSSLYSKVKWEVI